MVHNYFAIITSNILKEMAKLVSYMDPTMRISFLKASVKCIKFNVSDAKLMGSFRFRTEFFLL